ncbi:MAG: type VI secretion system baseplate subunit TssG [Cytophagales bacterium]|nr:type VI secretion system baseplate subunit TssG [Cytophagales bacterium]
MKKTISHPIARLPLAKERMEVVLQDLVARGLLVPEAITVHPQGLFARGYNGDVLGASWSEKEGRLDLHVCREGLYDMLPKALFHPPRATATTGLLEDRLLTVQQTAEEEESARAFFLPFEQEFFHHRLAIEGEESQLLAGFANPVQQLLFSRLFGKPDFLTPHQEQILFYLFPFFARITGDPDLTARSLASLLGHPVRVTTSHATGSLPATRHARLAEAQVGDDFILGDVTSEGFAQLHIVVGPVPADDLDKYLPGGVHRRLIAYLAGYLLPVEMAYEVEIIAEPRASRFALNDASPAARLGYSTVLGKE